MASGLLARAIELRETGTGPDNQKANELTLLQTAAAGKAAKLLEKLRAQGCSLAGAESCTGGLISALLTSVPGSSDVFRGAVVSYTSEIKHTVLYVPQETIETYGVVSEQVAAAMVKGASFLTGADTAYSVTGVAGPGGGTRKTPVGTVCFGFLKNGAVAAVTQHFEGDRDAVRRQAAEFVLSTLLV